MRGLAGDFATMPLKDLVVYLGNRRATGALRLERAGVQKQVALRDGQVVNASSNQPREYFGQFLINMGHLTEEQFMKAYATQKQTRVFLGKILVMIGLVTEQAVLSALNMKFRETLLDAFAWDEGAFSFDPDATLPSFEGMEVVVDLLDIHREGEFRETAWQAIRQAFPSGSVRLAVDESRLPQPPKPGSLDARLVALIHEDMTIDDMVLALHASDFFLYQRLYALYRLEAVRVAEEPLNLGEALEEPPSVIGAESPASEVVAAARNFLDAGNLRDGEALARRAHEMDPSTETAELLKGAESALLGQLRRELLDRPQVPSLLVPPAHLKTLALTAPERYLLSRIDGRRDVANIVHVSPLQELEALRYLQGFVDSGLVRMTPKPRATPSPR
ncbi:DUF4388 domain-containing protein [Aggregicoccus sp. 17bor-14]|uniref:DUF4388 domain-containing protein n=1 Tax=Myxococcaceae TaxID=31 RepID=UPI00129C623F|nr:MULTISPECIES: DUF4388 domain-containing protein [Myxococcaceae]MBF5041112.1 DUF4388 domain-containing protein [Simulacricoccus sp. 17bor-14]MRI86899.1 DUF4388 domain-containing protein [Aggregicoccus sp. 17bor-14]